MPAAASDPPRPIPSQQHRKEHPCHAIRHHHVEIDGLKVFLREAGHAARPTLVLLPGYPSSTRSYIRLIDQLSPNRHTVAIDYLGFGSSDPLSESPTFDRHPRSGKPADNSWFVAKAASSLTSPSPLGLFESRFAHTLVDRPKNTPTSTKPPSLPRKDRPSARTKDWPTTTRSTANGSRMVVQEGVGRSQPDSRVHLLRSRQGQRLPRRRTA